jgi:hypothetical protein
LSALIYETFEPGPGVEKIDAKTLNVSSGGACILTESVHEPGMLLNLWPRLQGAEANVKRGPLIARVRWISPSWVTHINAHTGQGTMSSETLVKGSFVVGLEFLPDGV